VRFDPVEGCGVKHRIEQLAEGVTLYLGDCRDILPTLPKIDVVTDPPYGIGFKYEGDFKDSGGDQYRELIATLRPFPRIAMLDYAVEMMREVVPILGAPDDCLAWVYPSNTEGRHFRLWGLWGLRANLSAVKQPARNPEVSKVKNLMVDSYTWWEQPQVKNTSLEKTDHPCQVPISAVQRVIRLTEISETILDPFMGSGTTGVAAVKLGHKFIGIERVPKYFDIACRQINHALDQPDFFIKKPTLLKQETLL
jgi:DNA modification methylase